MHVDRLEIAAVRSEWKVEKITHLVECLLKILKI